jgi:hypothetical protein
MKDGIVFGHDEQKEMRAHFIQETVVLTQRLRY